MTTPQEPPELLDELIGSVLQDQPDDPARRAIAMDPREVRILDDLRALSETESPREEFVHELELRLFEHARPAPQPSSVCAPAFIDRIGSWGRSWLARVAILACILIGVCGGLVASPQVRAQIAQLSCFVPGVGIRSCEASGLVAAGPVSVSRDGITLTVTNLLSSGGQTTVQLEVTGLPGPLPPGGALTSWLRLSIQDATGRAYPGEGQFWSQVPSGASWTRSTEWKFAQLRAGTKLVDLQVTGDPPLGSWTVQVPLIPVQKAGLTPAQEGPAAVTHHGATVRIASLVADHQRTALQLTAQAEQPSDFVRTVGSNWPRRTHGLVLRDGHGRGYQEIPALSPALLTRGSSPVDTEDVLFPPLEPGVRSVTLTVPFVILLQQTPALTVQVPVAGKQVGDHIPLAPDYRLGASSFRIIDAEIVDERGQPRLLLHLDLGGWHDGRELVAPGGVSSPESNPRDFQIQQAGDVGQWTELSVPLPQAATAAVNLTFQGAVFAVQGPWNLQAPVNPRP